MRVYNTMIIVLRDKELRLYTPPNHTNSKQNTVKYTSVTD